jgi:subtilisin family serine protease
VDGNPFARVFAAAMHWPVRPDEAHVDRDIMARLADRHTEAVREMQAAGVRVVNMSWGVMPQTFEALLARQGGIDDAQERKRCAAEFLAIERRALEGAIRSAPEILFVAAAGNSADDADFADIVPSNLALPNLITVGAVDRSGQEAPFTTVGRTVALHANGVEVASVLPGGTALRISGTSVAAPQVTNTAAKLVACRPGFTGAELRALLIESAEPAGRLRRLHPRRAFEVAQIPLP